MAQTALYVKGIQNDTLAKSAFVQASGSLGDLEEGLRSKRGMDAVNAYPQFKKDVTQVYQDAIQNAPNPQVARMLGDALSRRVTYSIEDAGKHVGQQQFVAADKASDDNSAGALSTIAQNPANPDIIRQSLDILRSEAKTKTQLNAGGASDFNQRAERMVSEGLTIQLKAIGFDQPQVALQMLDANQKLPDSSPYKMKGVSPDGKSYVENVKEWLQSQNNRKGAATTADEITADMTPDSGADYTEKKLAEARKKAEPFGSEFKEHLLARVESNIRQNNTVYRSQESETFASLSREITGADGGAPITDRDGLLNNPIRYQKYEALSGSARGQLMQNRLLAMVDAQGKKGALGEIAQQQLVNELIGLGVDAEQDPTKRDEFVNRVSEAFPQVDDGRRKALSGELTRILRAAQKPEADPTHLSMVMRTLDPILLAHNIDRQAPDDAGQKRYLQIQGLIYQKLQEMTARGEQVPSNPVKLQELFSPLIPSVGLSSTLRATTPPQVKFTGRTASSPGKPTLRETTDGQWVP